MELKVRRIWKKVEELRARVAPSTSQKDQLVYDLGSLLFLTKLLFITAVCGAIRSL